MSVWCGLRTGWSGRSSSGTEAVSRVREGCCLAHFCISDLTGAVEYTAAGLGSRVLDISACVGYD